MRAERKIRTGELVRSWRKLRGLSQSEVAAHAETSTRNLSVIENGHTVPSEPLLERLCETLALPLRERQLLLRTAGYGRTYAPIDLDEAEREELFGALQILVDRFDSSPALLMNRMGQHLASNFAFRQLANWLSGRTLSFGRETPSLYELMLSEQGWRPCLVNVDEIVGTFFQRLHRDAAIDNADGAMTKLNASVTQEGNRDEGKLNVSGDASPLVHFHCRRDGQNARLDSVVFTVGTPADISFQEVRLRYFLPADDETQHFLAQLVETQPADGRVDAITA